MVSEALGRGSGAGSLECHLTGQAVINAVAPSGVGRDPPGHDLGWGAV